MPETLSIDGFGPLPVHRPASVADVCTLVKQQRAAKQGVYSVGGRTQLDFGLVPTKPGIALDLTALNKVIDYPARDMTITVEAGITLAELQAVLATEGQWLPLDAPHQERSTLGGLVATNTSGPRRLGYGTLRDFVIGISFINDNGDEIKGGGRVVKNVAGYDLMKLHTGALGTLGVITQLTLKVRPKPEKKALVLYTIDIDEMSQVLETLYNSSSRPVAVRALNSGTVVLLHVLFEEKAITVQQQLSTIRNELTAIGIDVPKDFYADFSNYDVEGVVDGMILAQTHNECKYLAKLSVKPSDVVNVLRDLPGESKAQSDVFNGIIWVGHSESFVVPSKAIAVVHRAPAQWKTPERVFGKPTPAFELMRHIKRTLDPDDVFNPGRMFV